LNTEAEGKHVQSNASFLFWPWNPSNTIIVLFQ
jgi:hypothetical protein